MLLSMSWAFHKCDEYAVFNMFNTVFTRLDAAASILFFEL